MAARKKSARDSVPAATPTRAARGKTRERASFPVPPPRAGLPSDYAKTLGAIKQRIQQERLRVVLAANSAMVLLYWDVGRLILERQESAGWGASGCWEKQRPAQRAPARSNGGDRNGIPAFSHHAAKASAAGRRERPRIASLAVASALFFAASPIARPSA